MKLLTMLGSTPTALLMSLLLGCAPSMPPSDPHPLGQQKFPASREMTVEGQRQTLPVAGKVTLVDVWSTSCKPCMKLIPRYEKLWKERRAAGLEVVGVAVDDNPGLVLETMKQLGVSYPNIVDASGNIRATLRSAELPQSFVVDKAGQVRLVKVGGEESDADAIEQAVVRLLSE